MKALVLNGTNGIRDLEYVNDRTVPTPLENEIAVKVEAVGLNPVDYELTEGWGDVERAKKPVLGLDVAGYVHAVGSEVTSFKKGDRVYYHGSLGKDDGGFAEYACTTAHTVSHLPDKVDFIVAASVPCAGFTAYQAVVRKLKPEKGRTILIHGGAGGVGGFAVQLAKRLYDLTVFSTCREENSEYVKSLGADHTIDYTKKDTYETIAELTGGRGVDYVVNTVSESTATKDIGALAFGGQLVAIAELPDFSRIKFYEKGLSIHEVALGGAHINGDYIAQRDLAKIGDEFAALLSDGKISPPDITQIRLEEIPDYLYKLKERHVRGKIVAKL